MTKRTWLGLTLLTLSGFGSARVVDQPLFVRPPQIQAPEVTPVALPIPRPATPAAGTVKPLPVTLPAARVTPAPALPASGVRPAAGEVRVSPAQPSGVKPTQVQLRPGRPSPVQVQRGGPALGGLGLRATGGGAPSSTVLHPSLGFKPLSIVFRRSQ